jgi:exodeoxyribonuclease VII small subunit
MNKKKINENNINNLSFEEALEELENITETFEDGDSALENAVNLYNRGVLLKKHCEKKLKEAKKKIDEVKVNSTDSTIEKKI